jgi:hypothetical protein
MRDLSRGIVKRFRSLKSPQYGGGGAEDSTISVNPALPPPAVGSWLFRDRATPAPQPTPSPTATDSFFARCARPERSDVPGADPKKTAARGATPKPTEDARYLEALLDRTLRTMDVQEDQLRQRHAHLTVGADPAHVREEALLALRGERVMAVREVALQVLPRFSAYQPLLSRILEEYDEGIRACQSAATAAIRAEQTAREQERVAEAAVQPVTAAPDAEEVAALRQRVESLTKKLAALGAERAADASIGHTSETILRLESTLRAVDEQIRSLRAAHEAEVQALHREYAARAADSAESIASLRAALEAQIDVAEQRAIAERASTTRLELVREHCRHVEAQAALLTARLHDAADQHARLERAVATAEADARAARAAEQDMQRQMAAMRLGGSGGGGSAPSASLMTPRPSNTSHDHAKCEKPRRGDLTPRPDIAKTLRQVPQLGAAQTHLSTQALCDALASLVSSLNSRVAAEAAAMSEIPALIEDGWKAHLKAIEGANAAQKRAMDLKALMDVATSS